MDNSRFTSKANPDCFILTEKIDRGKMSKSSVNAEEIVAKRAQKCFASNPVVVLGSGASVPHGLPSMSDLQKWLLANVTAEVGAEEDGWLLIRVALAAGDHLEQALASTNLPKELIRSIAKETWKCVSKADSELFSRAVSGSEQFPVSKLLKALFESSNNSVDVVTTNYDRVVEYACGEAAIMYSAGFDPGYIQAWQGGGRVSFSRGNRPARTIRLWKVHGSLDWFERTDGTLVGGPLDHQALNGLTPLIISPGVSKYERTHAEPFRSAIQGADRSLEGAQAYLCAGFGFRDTHIEPKMINRCRHDNVPTVIISRTLTLEAREFLRSKAGSNYLGIEKFEDFSKAYMPEYPDGIKINIVDAWSVGGFLRLVK